MSHNELGLVEVLRVMTVIIRPNTSEKKLGVDSIKCRTTIKFYSRERFK